MFDALAIECADYLDFFAMVTFPVLFAVITIGIFNGDVRAFR